MRKVRTNAELAAIHRAGLGVVFNDFTSGPAGARDDVVHVASCIWVGKMLAGAVPEGQPSVRKIFFDTVSEAASWLEQRRGQEGHAWKYCSRCRPSSLGAGERPIGPGHSDPRAGDAVAAFTGVIPRRGAPGPAPVTADELDRLAEACQPLQVSPFAYEQHDYMTNVLLTVLDLQMHNTVVESSIRHYWTRRQSEICTLADLAELLARFPDDRDGNHAIANYLWGNNHWTRVQWLRGFARFLAEEHLQTQETLIAWARHSDFDRDFRGRVKHLGPAAYSWLVMRLGVDKVKPDVHLRRFVERTVGHPVSDAELATAVAETAHRLGHSARELDAAIWEHERGAPGAV